MVLYGRRGHVATITMNRHQVANTQDAALIDGIDACFDQTNADDEVRVVVLAGNGKHLSSGHDLKALVGNTEPDECRPHAGHARGQLPPRAACSSGGASDYHFRKPTIAAVQATCVAAG